MLDINTTKGQRYAAHQMKVQEALEETMPQFRFEQTHIERASPIDGMSFSDKGLVGIYEIRCREDSWEQIEKWGSWMVTEDKLLKGIELAVALKADYFVFIHTIKDGQIHSARICDHRGRLRVKYDTRFSLTHYSMKTFINW